MPWLALTLMLAQLPHEADFRQGLRAFEAGEYRRAQALLEKALALRPGDREIAMALGMALAADGQTELAEPHFREACLAPQPPAKSCYYWGRALYFLNRFEAALDAYRKERGTTPDLLSARAQAFAGLDRLAEAEPLFRAALAGSKGDAAARIGTTFATFLYRQGRMNEALTETERAIETQPKFAAAWKEKGRVLVQLGRGGALDAYRRALELGLRTPDVLLPLSRILEANGDAQTAARYRAEASAMSK